MDDATGSGRRLVSPLGSARGGNRAGMKGHQRGLVASHPSAFRVPNNVRG
jgi:hypothetical protein